MTEVEKQSILQSAKIFFKEKIFAKHIENTKKLKNLAEFNVNPFLTSYLANFLTGNDDAKSIAKALIYPRALGTSITTSFGTQLQYFCSIVLSGFSSTTSGIDIEFIDQIDLRRKYCQVKAGPNTINKDDVKTIIDHFTSVKNLSRTNGLNIPLTDMIVGVFYGSHSDLSGHYLKINENHPVLTGIEFWHHLTGDPSFYTSIIDAISEIAIEYNGSELLESVINDLADEIETTE